MARFSSAALAVLLVAAAASCAHAQAFEAAECYDPALAFGKGDGVTFSAVRKVQVRAGKAGLLNPVLGCVSSRKQATSATETNWRLVLTAACPPGAVDCTATAPATYTIDVVETCQSGALKQCGAVTDVDCVVSKCASVKAIADGDVGDAPIAPKPKAPIVAAVVAAGAAPAEAPEEAAAPAEAPVEAPVEAPELAPAAAVVPRPTLAPLLAPLLAPTPAPAPAPAPMPKVVPMVAPAPAPASDAARAAAGAAALLAAALLA